MPIFGAGTTVEYGDDVLAGTPVWTEVEELMQVGVGVGFSVENEDTTSMQSALADRMRRRSPTLADREAMPFGLWYDPSLPSHRFLTNLENARTVRAWRVTLPNGYGCTFDGYVENLSEPEANADGHLQATGALRISANYALIEPTP